MLQTAVAVYMICINNTIHKLSSKLKFPLGMKRKNVCHTSESSQLSQLPKEQICQRIWGMTPVLFSFIKMCKHFFSTTSNHTWELWKVIWSLYAWQLSINPVISFCSFFFWTENDWNKLPRVTVRAQHFKAETTETQTCEPWAFQNTLT